MNFLLSPTESQQADTPVLLILLIKNNVQIFIVIVHIYLSAYQNMAVQ